MHMYLQEIHFSSSIYVPTCTSEGTSFGVHSHFQQQPAKVLCLGKPNVSPKNFQSPLTSTRTAWMAIDLPASLARLLSVFLHAVSSWRTCGKEPKKHCTKLHLMISKISCHVFLPICFLDMAVMGRRRALYSFWIPGKLMLKVSPLSLLSQFTGTPSPQRPMATNDLPASICIC